MDQHTPVCMPPLPLIREQTYAIHEAASRHLRVKCLASSVHVTFLHYHQHVTEPVLDEQVLPQSHLGRARRWPSRQIMTRPLHVLLAAQYSLQTNPVTQPRVRYIHTAMPHASYSLRYTVFAVRSPP